MSGRAQRAKAAWDEEWFPPQQLEEGQSPPARNPLRTAGPGWVLLLIFGLGLSLAGCSSLRKQDADDPLVGPGPKGLRPPAGNNNSRTQASLPPLPATNSSASTADLAVGGQLVGGRPLSIEDRPARPGTWEGIGPDGRPLPPKNEGVVTASGVTLHQPQPLTAAASPPTSGGLIPVPVYGQGPTVPATTPAASPALASAPLAVPASPAAASTPPATSPTPPSAEQLLAQLRARGAVLLRQEVTRDGVFVRCAAPSPADPSRQQVYEVTAPTITAALEALLQHLGAPR